MAWLTPQEFKESSFTASSAEETTVEQLADALEAAKDVIVGLAGESVLTEIGNEDDNDLPKVRRFRRAQKKIAQRELLDDVSFRFADGGIRKRETDSNASSVNEYEPIVDTLRRKQELYAEAVALIQVYLPSVETIEPVQSRSYTESVPIEFVW